MNSALTWFEIPAKDINRAQRFYEEVLQIKMIDPNEPFPMRIFPAQPPAIQGAISKRDDQTPSDAGTKVYLRLNGDVDAAIERVSKAGGSIVVPKFSAPNVPGAMFCLKDTEGNVVGVHSI